jgi:hypothetical protein
MSALVGYEPHANALNNGIAVWLAELDDRSSRRPERHIEEGDLVLVLVDDERLCPEPRGPRRLTEALAHEDFLSSGDNTSPDTELNSVAAPVFGADGTMRLTICLMPNGRYLVRDIPELARAVVRAAGRVTAAIDGRQPSPDATRGVTQGYQNPPARVTMAAAEPVEIIGGARRNRKKRSPEGRREIGLAL